MNESYSRDHDGLPSTEEIVSILHASHSFPEGWTAEAVALNAGRFPELPALCTDIRMRLREIGCATLSQTEIIQFVHEEVFSQRGNVGWKPVPQNFGKIETK